MNVTDVPSGVGGAEGPAGEWEPQPARAIDSQMRTAVRRSIRYFCTAITRTPAKRAEAYNRRKDLMRKARKLEVIRADLRRIWELTFEHQAFFIERWHEYFRHQR